MTHKEQGNLTLWAVAIRLRLRTEHNERKRKLLGEMLVEINARLPERPEVSLAQ